MKKHNEKARVQLSCFERVAVHGDLSPTICKSRLLAWYSLGGGATTLNINPLEGLVVSHDSEALKFASSCVPKKPHRGPPSPKPQYGFFEGEKLPDGTVHPKLQAQRKTDAMLVKLDKRNHVRWTGHLQQWSLGGAPCFLHALDFEQEAHTPRFMHDDATMWSPPQGCLRDLVWWLPMCKTHRHKGKSRRAMPRMQTYLCIFTGLAHSHWQTP